MLAAEFTCGGVRIGGDELRLMHKTTLAVFTVLEKLWASLGVALIDMKIEFGVDKESGELTLTARLRRDCDGIVSPGMVGTSAIGSGL